MLGVKLANAEKFTTLCKSSSEVYFSDPEVVTNETPSFDNENIHEFMD